MIIKEPLNIESKFHTNNMATIYNGNCIDFLNTIPDNSIQLIVTSPPYNIGKEYEKQTPLEEYISFQINVINLCIDKLKEGGSICWEVGNFVENSSIIPLDILLFPIFAERNLKLRNRIVWHFRHGLHASKRFSGRYEVILWFTKGEQYKFNLDAVRVPQKYPGKKHFKGKKKGEYSSNPLGMNPSDTWEDFEIEKSTDFWDIPNVKSNHVEKTIHPAQFPISLVQRLIKSLTDENDIVFDPFLGVGTTTAAGIELNRKVCGTEMDKNYYNIALKRTNDAYLNILQKREDKPVYKPSKKDKITKNPYQASLNL